ncbi:MAG: hypothetical protein RL462_1551 [Pseudomonadota bacterium]
MSQILKLLTQMNAEPANVKFADLQKVCIYYFGQPRFASGSHVVFKMPWIGDPRINIQNFKGKAKPYQVRQALSAIQKLLIQNEH